MQRIRWLDGITDSVDINFSKLWKIAEDRGGWCTAIHGVSESDTTSPLSKNSNTDIKSIDPIKKINLSH